MRRALSCFSLLALFSIACSSGDPASGISASQLSGDGSSDRASTGGSAGASAINEALLPSSGIPLLSAQNVAKPAGSPGNLKVLDWAGFKAAVSYTFDDSNPSQIKHYADLQALGVHYSFYLITGRSQSQDPVWKQAVMDGHE